jgi:hypothetical protein
MPLKALIEGDIPPSAGKEIVIFCACRLQVRLADHERIDIEMGRRIVYSSAKKISPTLAPSPTPSEWGFTMA